MKQFLTKTKNGIDVFVDLEHSHAATHLRENDGLLEVVKKIISEYETVHDHDRFETNTGRTIGVSDLIVLEPSDETFYALRANRERYSHFVKDREAQPESVVTVDLKKNNEGSYDLYTCWIGGMVPSFPFDKNDLGPEERDFWSKHALAVGKQEILEETITKECPW